MSDPTPQPPYGASPYAPPRSGASPYVPSQPAPSGQPPSNEQSPYAPPSPSAQPPYPTQPYTQPTYPPVQAPGPYAQPPAAYAPGVSPYAPPVPARSPLPGRIGLGIVVLSMVVATVAAWIVGVGYGQLFVQLVESGRITAGSSQLDSQTLQRDPLFQQFVANNTAPITAMSMASWLGIAGWITSIVAVARRTGRTPGIWGIVLGILAPVALIAAMVLAALPAIQSLI